MVVNSTARVQLSLQCGGGDCMAYRAPALPSANPNSHCCSLVQPRAQPGTVTRPVLRRRERRRQLALAAQVGRGRAVRCKDWATEGPVCVGCNRILPCQGISRQQLALPCRTGLHPYRLSARLPPCPAASGHAGPPAAACWARWQPRRLSGAWKWCPRPSSAPTPCRCAGWAAPACWRTRSAACSKLPVTL